MAGNVCWGVEAGSGGVKAIKLERSGDGVNVLDFAIIPHKKVLSSPDIDPNEAMRVALGTLVSQFDLTTAPVSVSVAGHSAFARFAKLPPVEPKKIPDIVKFEAVQQIPFPIEEVEWDYQTFVSPDSPDVEVGIFAITRERVNERLSMWEDLRITPAALTLSPLGAYNAVAYDMVFTEKTPGTIILDVGTTSTDLIVAESGRVWIRTFPIGGHQFTEALVDAFKLTYPKAEKLKKEAENTKHARHILQAMRPVFSDLAQEAQRSVGYYQSVHRECKLTRVIALGATFNLPGLRKYLGQQLQMEVVTLEGYARANIDGDRGEAFKAAAGELATAYGLALQGVGFGTINANLMPAAIVRSAMWEKKTKWFAAAAGIAVATGAVSFVKPFLDGQAVAAHPRPAVIQEVVSQANEIKSKWSEVENAGAADGRAAKVGTLLTQREIFPFAVNDVGTVLAEAQAKLPAAASAEHGLRFVSFETQYVGPGGGVSEEEMSEAERRRMEDSGGESEGESEADQATRGRIYGTLEISTTAPDAERFVTSTIQKWLVDNAKREGVPYVIKTAQIPWQMTKTESGSGGEVASASGSGTGRPSVAASRPPRGERRPTPPGSRGGASRTFEEGGGRYDDEPDEGGGYTIGDASSDPSMRGGGGGGVGAQAAPRQPSQEGGKHADLDKLASLPGKAAEVPPGATSKTFVIKWEMVIRDPATEAAGEEGGK